MGWVARHIPLRGSDTAVSAFALQQLGLNTLKSGFVFCRLLLGWRPDELSFS